MKKMLFVFVVMVCFTSGVVNAAIESISLDSSDPLSLSLSAEQYFISCDLDIRVSDSDTAAIGEIFDWNSFTATDTYIGYQFGEREIAWLSPAAVVNGASIEVDGFADVVCTATSGQASVYKKSEMFSVALADGWSFAGVGETPIATVEIFANSIDSFQTAGDYTDAVVASVGVVPEPVSVGLLAMGGLALLKRKR